MSQTRNYDVKYLVKLLIGIFCMFCFRYVVPTWANITPVGVACVGIFIGVVFLMSSGFGLLFPSLLGMFAMQMTGFYNSATLLSGSFGTTTVFQLIVVYALCQALVSSGAGEVIARWFISRKFTVGRPMMFTVMFLLGSVFMGALLEMGGLIIYYSLLESIRKELGYEEDSKWNKFMILGVITCVCAGIPVIPFKSIPLLIFGTTLASMLANYGLAINYVEYMIAALSVSVLYVLAYCLIFRFIWRVDVSRLKNFDPSMITGEVKMNSTQATISYVAVIAILYPAVQIFLPPAAKFTVWYNSISVGTWFSVCMGALFVLRADGKPLVNGSKLLSEGVDWNILFATAMFTLLGGMLSSPTLGIRSWISDVMSSVIGDMSFPGFLLVVILISVIPSNFFSTVATGTIVTTLVTPFIVKFVETLGINPSVVGSAIVCSIMFAYLTMAASGVSPIFLGQPAVRDDNKLVWVHGTSILVPYVLICWLVHLALAYVL